MLQRKTTKNMREILRTLFAEHNDYYSYSSEITIKNTKTSLVFIPVFHAVRAMYSEHRDMLGESRNTENALNCSKRCTQTWHAN